MKRTLYILKSVLICLCTGLVLGFFGMVTVWLVSDSKPDPAQCLRILKGASAIGALTAALARLLYALFETFPISHALKLAEREGEYEKAYRILEKKAEKTSSADKKSSYRLVLSALYTENEEFDKALDTLEAVDFTALSAGLQQEYFNAYMYTYLLKGDFENADKVYSEAAPYFEEPAPSVLHTLGVYEYSKGEYGKARSYLLRSKEGNSGSRNCCDCDLYLALCALKEGKVDDAKALADEAQELLVTKNEERDLKKLRHLIEKYEAPDEAQAEETEAGSPTPDEERTTEDND